ncbi:MAG: right-handed parallel beta-helix repeat-containing protein [Candidatus Cloacimonetes bacterium]|nr:right-handed parallel beta-helix repeat-containing protein [Candidatus Cloacimonadota bacterium]MCF7814687.1 right-handed parallel beta-helix repeat-containing protein [Candidatus Cloacimonadota bacterium]MCF7868249.1 right-handed parallel beta-helix repeat-containing protein [Candidatus Cloacimonadota bacterium]MCF7883682.1 right-handed parallel beta-helix repeat-containing protein [Candidatus Cloacimonadota bacterium]
MEQKGHNKIFRFNLFFILLFISFSGMLFSIEVAGHLTEDTIWSPVNNPYQVTGFVYVDSGVTLKILPGTVVQFDDAIMEDTGNDEFWFHIGSEPIAKSLHVEGRLIAEGTVSDSIIFTRTHNEPFRHWGIIYLTEEAELSSFRHCVIEYSGFTGYSLMEQIYGGIAVYNGSVKIENCTFIDNRRGVNLRSETEQIIIKDCNFQFIGPLLTIPYKLISGGNGCPNSVLIANNTFNSLMISSDTSAYFIFNKGIGLYGETFAMVLDSPDQTSDPSIIDCRIETFQFNS